MNFIKHVLLWFSSEGDIRLQPRLLFISGTGLTKVPAACLGSRASCPVECLSPSSAQSVYSVHRHTDRSSSGTTVTGQGWEGTPGQKTAPFCLSRTLELGPGDNDGKLTVAWAHSASFSHWEMFVPWEGPRPHLTTQLHCLVRSFHGKY